MTATLGAVFLDVSERHAARPALVFKEKGHFRTLTWRQFQERALQLANWFIAADLAVGDRVALLCETRHEWLIADMAMQLAGLVNVPLYPTLAGRQAAFVLRDSGTRLLIVSSRKQLEKVLAVAPDCPDLERILVIDDMALPSSHLPLMRWHDALAAGAASGPEMPLHRADRQASIDPASLCSILYTSGTTGDPKGVMLSHRNFLSNVRGLMKRLDVGAHDTALSFLPLSHVLERLASYAMMASGATIAYAESLDTLPADLQDVKPTVLTTVPRILDKIRADILADLGRRSRWEESLLPWALAVGKVRHIERGLHPAFPLADRLVLRDIRRRFGGRVRHVFCGGAPLDPAVGEFVASAGVPVFEGYGLTETGPVVAVNHPGSVRFGTVGPLLPEVTVRLDADGEVCVKGPGVMMGYFRREAETQEAFDGAGWFHTGDLGALDDDGHLRITGRKKEVIVLSNGKKVGPQPIESLLTTSPLIAQAMLVGDNRQYVAALLVPEFSELQRLPEARADADTAKPLLERPELLRRFRLELDRLGAELAPFEQIKRFVLVAEPWTVEGGDLTPTQKLKRPEILKRCASQVESLYTGAGTFSA